MVRNSWDFKSVRYGREADRHGQSLELGWYLNWESITDSYTPTEIAAENLFQMWLERLGDINDARINWIVWGVSEGAPFVSEDDEEDFLTHYTWPTHSDTGEALNWLTLPIEDKAWNERRSSKGGFIQEVTGWKPSALQRSVHLPTLLRASGWT